MKVTKHKESKIAKEVAKTAELYLAYKRQSAVVNGLMYPLMRQAKTKEDVEVLLNLTVPYDTKGNYISCGDYIGRFDLYYLGETLKKKQKKN